MLCNHLNYIAPDGHSFGIRYGTQADFGFWRMVEGRWPTAQDPLFQHTRRGQT